MKILVISQNFYPEEFKINEIVEELVKRGNEVTVLTGLPNYPTGIIPKEYKFFKKRKDIYKGAKVIRTLEIPRKNNKIGLFINYLSIMLSSTVKVIFMKRDFDAVFVYQPSPVTNILPAVVAKFLSKIPVYTYCLDLWPESMKVMLNNENHIAYKISKKISRFLYKNSTKIGITSKSFEEYLTREHGIDQEKIEYLPQHGEEVLDNLDSTNSSGCNFFFLGNIGKAQDVDTICKATNQIKHENFLVHFVGDGSELDNLKTYVKENNLNEKIIFHGRHPKSELNKFYTMADSCLVTLDGSNFIGNTMPTKLQSYMACGKPICAAINGSAQDVIKESNCGLFVGAGDFNGLAGIMKKYIDMSHEDRIKLGHNGREYFDNNFTLDIFMNNLLCNLEDMVKGENNV